MQPITLQPIDTPLELMCSHCDHLIYRVFKNKTNERSEQMTAINLPISCAEVYWCIADSESINSQEISEKTGLAKSTVQGHLGVLEKGNAIKSQGRPKQYCVSENVPSEILEWLREFEELARATRDFRGRTLPLLHKEKQFVSHSPTH